MGLEGKVKFRRANVKMAMGALVEDGLMLVMREFENRELLAEALACRCHHTKENNSLNKLNIKSFKLLTCRVSMRPGRIALVPATFATRRWASLRDREPLPPVAFRWSTACRLVNLRSHESGALR
jgi:hypothetical protein